MTAGSPSPPDRLSAQAGDARELILRAARNRLVERESQCATGRLRRLCAFHLPLRLNTGWRPIGRAFAAAGWSGLAALCVAASTCYLFSCVRWRWRAHFSWRVHRAPSRRLFGRAGCVTAQETCYSALPTAGEVIAARELSLHGIRLSLAGATTIVDLTIEILSQLLFTLLGLGFLLAGRPGAGGAWWAVGSRGRHTRDR